LHELSRTTVSGARTPIKLRLYRRSTGRRKPAGVIDRLPKEVAMSVLSPGRRALPAVVALVALLALAGEVPASTTQAPSSTDTTLAIERAYSSYGDAPPVADREPRAAGDGISIAPFLLALSGALVIGLAVGSLSSLVTARRRARIGEVS
jgi:hypothetical protein